MTSNPIRRGLPRVPGGEPWPPARGSDPSTSGATDADGPATDPPAPAVPAPAAPAPGPAAEPTPAVAAEPTPRPVAESVEASGTARRGLPRVPGGEPWPPAPGPDSSTISATDAGGGAPTAPPGDPAPPADTAPPADPAPPADTAPPAERAPAAEATPGPVGEPVHASGTVRRGLPRTSAPAEPRAPAEPPAPTSAAPPAPRAPLPFTRTVWAGAAASGPRGATLEPKRYGPFTRGQWIGAVVIGGGGLLFAAAMAVFAVRWLLSLDALQDWLVTYPGEYHLPEGAPVGFPAWLNWAHFLNTFFLLLIIRSGLQVRREKRPGAFWTPRWNRKRKISLALWFHQSLDILWMLNGLVFVVLLFVSGQWMRIVPTSWEMFPNALSAALQYVSLDWPTENGWVNYNSLQQLAYFTTVFVAAPLAIVTGVRMSGVWPKNAATLNRVYPVEWARRVHFPVMLYFIAFIVVHVALVFATGALRNLNHMYAAQGSTDPNAYADNWAGFWIFAASMLVLAAGWVAARPLVLAPIAGLFGTVKSR